MKTCRRMPCPVCGGKKVTCLKSGEFIAEMMCKCEGFSTGIIAKEKGRRLEDTLNRMWNMKVWEAKNEAV